MNKLVNGITIGTLGLLTSAITLTGCGNGNGSDLAGDGEACEKTADCEGVLRCLDQVCVSGEDTDTEADVGTPEEDLSDLIYDPVEIVEVVIEMSAEDWDLIRNDTRDISGMSGENCYTEPFYSTYTWKSADVTVDGTAVENVGIRKKGFVGSVNSEKPGLKLKFNKYVENQLPFGMERMTLNNNTSDPSFIRQCLTYYIFQKAGIAAPRCNFATVRVNGQDLGLYTNVEPIKKRFLARHFTSNDGDLYEATGSDFRDDWMGTFEDKTTETDITRAKIVTITKALKLPDDELMAALEPLVDLDAFATYWALEGLLTHADGLTGGANNCYIYFDPGPGKMYAIPWGVDKTFIPAEWGLPAVFANTILPRRLYNLPAGQEMYVAAVQDLLNNVWKEAELQAEIDRMATLLAPLVAKDPWFATAKDWSGNDADFAASVNELREFVTDRRAQMEAAIDNLPAWDEPLQDRNCSNDDTDGGKTDDGKTDATLGCQPGETFDKDGVIYECDENGNWSASA